MGISPEDCPIAADGELSAIEGDPRMFFHVRRERDPVLAEAKREATLAATGRLECEACGFITQAVFAGLAGEVCEIHHRLPLGKASDAVETRLVDLSVLCANCHRAIHRTKPLMSVEEFRTRFFSVARNGTFHHCRPTGLRPAAERQSVRRAQCGLRGPSDRIIAKESRMALTAEESRLKKLLKSAVVEALQERPDLMSEAVADAVEDIALARAIREGADTETVQRSDVFKVIRKKR